MNLTLPRALPPPLARLLSLRAVDPADFWHFWLFWSFWLSLALFPAGYGLREVMPPVSFVFLLLYMRHSRGRSVLARLGPAWLFGCLFGMVLIGIIFSGDIAASILHAGTGINKAFILPFIAMECVRRPKDLERLVWALVFACFWQGLDGLWQAYTGRDFIMGYPPNAGRLTGSLGDYTVGNYMALALVPAFGCWFMLRRGQGRPAAALLFTALFWPGFFLVQGASSRSALLALAAAPFLWAFLTRTPGALSMPWRRLALTLLPALLAFAAFAICQPQRLGIMQIAEDGRWSLWELGWRVFLEHPWLGAGAGRYNAAFRELGLAPARDAITISHPHNLYLDMLYAHGLAGFALGMTFLAGFLIWGYAKLRPRLASPDAGVYWRLCAWFWIGFAAWLVNGVFGHDFYRIWWLAMAMSHLGVMIGAIVNGPAAGAAAASRQ